jgi:hypothetical protein
MISSILLLFIPQSMALTYPLGAPQIKPFSGVFVVCNAYRPAELIATSTPEIHFRAPQAQITTPKD